MRYYGLHFTSEDRTPLQVRVSSTGVEVWARSCPSGTWTPWRRLDVLRNSDGSLAETVEEASHARTADTAGRWRTSMRLAVTGDVTGEIRFDGSEDGVLETHIAGLAELLESAPDIAEKLEDLEKRLLVIEDKFVSTN